MRAVRGGRIGMVFQDPMTSLNPVLTAGDQIAEAVRAHRPVTRQEARARALALLGEVGIAGPGAAARRVPAPAERRHAPARDDRHRARGGAGDPHRRRADHRARRDGAGPDPRTARPAAARAGHGGAPDHARPGRGGGSRRRHVRHVRGPGRGARIHAARCSRRRRTRIRTDCSGRCRRSPARGSASRRSRASVPPPTAWPTGCRFAPRCPERFARCDSMPSLRRAGPGHDARCWLTGDEA